MTAVDDLWFLATQARQRAEQVYHELERRHDGYVEYTTTRRVSRERFRTVATRIEDCGLPYGSHTLAHRPGGRLALVRHEAVGMWVLPGGEVHDDEEFRDGARRELREEAGIEATYEGLGILGRVQFRCDDHRTWGVLPIYAARATETDLSVEDPDDEISEAKWFDELPPDTRDRDVLEEWRERRFHD
jgi:ADP-ribose pyrophosphatase YjhB (NUDIX family)